MGFPGIASGDIPLTNQANVTYTDPYGQGSGTYTLFYNLPSNVMVGTNLTVPFKLYVDNLTRLEGFLNSYNVTLTLTLSNGKQISDVAGVTGTQAAENLGALQLHAGQGWGPVNFTLPITASNTGLRPGQVMLGNATFTVYVQMYFNQPLNAFRFQSSTVKAAYLAVQNGTPSGSEVNVVGIAVLAAGVLILVVAAATRRKKTDSGAVKPSAGAVENLQLLGRWSEAMPAGGSAAFSSRARLGYLGRARPPSST